MDDLNIMVDKVIHVQLLNHRTTVDVSIGMPEGTDNVFVDMRDYSDPGEALAGFHSLVTMLHFDRSLIERMIRQQCVGAQYQGLLIDRVNKVRTESLHY